MKSKTVLFGSLAAAIALSLNSCGDGSTADTSAESAGPAAAEGTEYPLKVCVVSGEELGSMGKPVVINHEGTEVRFCCKECLPEFNKDPGKFIAMLKAGKAGTMEHGEPGQ